MLVQIYQKNFSIYLLTRLNIFSFFSLINEALITHYFLKNYQNQIAFQNHQLINRSQHFSSPDNCLHAFLHPKFLYILHNQYKRLLLCHLYFLKLSVFIRLNSSVDFKLKQNFFHIFISNMQYYFMKAFMSTLNHCKSNLYKIFKNSYHQNHRNYH